MLVWKVSMDEKNCSWCGREFTAMLLEEITVTVETENVTKTKYFQLCLDCMIASLTMKGMMLARTVPSDKDLGDG